MSIRSFTRKDAFLLILFLSFLSGTVSCKKDKSDSKLPPASARIQEFKNGEEFVRFEYHTDGTVKKATLKRELNTNGNIVDYNIAYNTAKEITSITTSAGEKIIPVYENGMLIRADIFEGSERTGYTNYHYVDKLLQIATLYWGSGTDFMPFLEFRFEYDHTGNVTEMVVMMATNILGQMTRAGHIEYQYDENSNPLYMHKELLAFLWEAASKNNILQEDHYDAGLTLEERHVYTYSYNSRGLPEQAEVKTGLPGQPPVSTAIDFIYQ